MIEATDKGLFLGEPGYYLVEIGPRGRTTASDGHHEDKAGALQAYKLWRGLGFLKPGCTYRVAHMEEVDLEAAGQQPVNEEALAICAAALDAALQPAHAPAPVTTLAVPKAAKPRTPKSSNAKPPKVALRYLCDENRHLICLPFSPKNMKQMAEELYLERKHLSKIPCKRFYRIPFDRIEEIQEQCERVPAWHILEIITSNE